MAARRGDDRATMCAPAFARSISTARCPAPAIRRRCRTQTVARRAARLCAVAGARMCGRRRRAAGLRDRHRGAGAGRRGRRSRRAWRSRRRGRARQRSRRIGELFAARRPRRRLAARHRARRAARRRVRSSQRGRLSCRRKARALEPAHRDTIRTSCSKRIRPTIRRRRALRALVRDHFAILKVGPGTDLRAARGALGARRDRARMARVRTPRPTSRDDRDRADERRPEVLARSTTTRTARALDFDLQYSLSDRIRYYWPRPRVRRRSERCFANLTRQPAAADADQPVPAAQYEAVRDGTIGLDPAELAMASCRRRARLQYQAARDAVNVT